MAQNKSKCHECGTVVTRLIREYNVRAAAPTDKNYFIGRFVTGLPNFKKGSENKWSLRKDIPQGRQFTDAQREKLKNKPWILEDETGQFQYQGHLEGSQSATYYLLVMQSKEFVAIPAGSWYNFNKVAQYKQLTLEEAEEKMKNRRKTADGYQRWMMKAANNGPALFGEVDNEKESGGTSGGGGRGRKKSSGGDEEEGNVSDRGDEDEEEEASRKSRLGLNRKSNDDDDEEGPRGGDLDMDDDDIEKGDDWEHEEIFTDDDEAVGNDPEEREDLLAPEIPAPPEIKQDEDDEENEEEEGGLSKSGKELKKLLGKANGLDESDEDDDDDSDDEEETNYGTVTNSKQKEAAKEEPVDNAPAKPAPSGPPRGTPPAKPSKGKRKLNDGDSKKPSSSVQKKVKTENDPKSSLKEERANTVSKSNTPTKAVKAEPASAPASSSSAATGPVTEDEIRAVLMEKKQVTTQDLVSRFKARLKTKEDKNAFANILRKISKIQKNAGSQNFVVLREKCQPKPRKRESRSNLQPRKMELVTEDEIRKVLMEKKQLTTLELVMRFKERLTTTEDKDSFSHILKKIAKLQKNPGSEKFVVVLRDNVTPLASDLTRLSIS
ncbi:Winged helix DNA-binding domain superfamily [Arabidopsis suecica]|uniref:Transcription initiation factor IIF subunit alpha n=1 Tax=Arabidopsis suecica TaxID=45249 RepID=A0A8T2E7M5_ARASU|nr:Winged helix DNA-binding domain superfamily [Arabidopsis suecica]